MIYKINNEYFFTIKLFGKNNTVVFENKDKNIINEGIIENNISCDQKFIQLKKNIFIEYFKNTKFIMYQLTEKAKVKKKSKNDILNNNCEDIESLFKYIKGIELNNKNMKKI